jgi:hypothetical protein
MDGAKLLEQAIPRCAHQNRRHNMNGALPSNVPVRIVAAKHDTSYVFSL